MVPVEFGKNPPTGLTGQKLMSLSLQLQNLQQILRSLSSKKPAIFMVWFSLMLLCIFNTLVLFMAVSFAFCLPLYPSFWNTIDLSKDILAPTYYTPPHKSRILLSMKDSSNLHQPKWSYEKTIHEMFNDLFPNEFIRHFTFEDRNTTLTINLANNGYSQIKELQS
ncbi:hypothetical protein HELRODRAFT_166152 [Helobdella robusta]|uniref:Uncharacterized protein n=1 Tax=Helobdella robusta TaxID=6412 RepID=T1EXU6_HELRO|nr:hypothetical protein HELRODRAFT_166152 [Helobdella robusta]ESN90482.1 hypothetical protein HELRODRAFT_166152 [Helobdella robusta]